MRTDLLPYAHTLDARPLTQVTLLVIHCTELPDLAAARAYGERVLYPASGTGNSGHWYIDRDGDTVQYVPHARIAHHVRGHNAHSVGVELVNRGRWPHWLAAAHQAMDEPYPPAQLHALCALIDTLCAQLPSLRHIAGHEDLDTERVPATDDARVMVQRKRDPGPQFPWPQVLARTALTRPTPRDGAATHSHTGHTTDSTTDHTRR